MGNNKRPRKRRPDPKRRDTIHKITKLVTDGLADDGRLVNAGWSTYMSTVYPQGVGENQRQGIRMAFFAGAQHVFGSIMTMFDPGDEPTDRDLRRITLIDHELRAFIDEYKQAQGIEDPDIGPEAETEN